MKKYIVIQDYENSNTEPIELNASDMVIIGEKFEDDEQWPNWIYCVSLKTGKGGWTPVQILRMDGGTGVAMLDYTAKEMTVAVGDIVSGDNEMNGWLWCFRKSDGQSGWVPQNCLKQYKSGPDIDV